MAYGYLDEHDIKDNYNCFENTEFLSETEIDLIQKLINLLTEKGT